MLIPRYAHIHSKQTYTHTHSHTNKTTAMRRYRVVHIYSLTCSVFDLQNWRNEQTSIWTNFNSKQMNKLNFISFHSFCWDFTSLTLVHKTSWQRMKKKMSNRINSNNSDGDDDDDAQTNAKMELSFCLLLLVITILSRITTGRSNINSKNTLN